MKAQIHPDCRDEIKDLEYEFSGGLDVGDSKVPTFGVTLAKNGYRWYQWSIDVDLWLFSFGFGWYCTYENDSQ